MKIKFIILTLCILLSLNFISAMGNPAAAYCKHMGYELREGICIFNNETSCNDWNFYEGTCGQEYVKEIPCRKIGEAVFTGFEECCAGGYVYAPGWTVGQSTCQSLSKVIIDEFRYNPFYWLGTLVVIGLIIYLIKKKRKK
ncbi:MAG TPA: DUF333 domain-containing protein [Candidatus Nanoarchaeia archaeon]|nr:DUF333 domain-containing protein [Candidatus Nanoarchaeia archaeon]